MSLPLPDSFNALLTEAECAQIDQTLLPTRDRFNIRLKLYSARYLTQIASQEGVPVLQLSQAQIISHLQSNPGLQEDGQPEANFIEWFGNLLNASIQSLRQIASDAQVEIENLKLEQIIDWHRKSLKESGV